MKEKVAIELLEDDTVAVYPYDENSKEVIGAPITVCHRIVANNDYDIIGEVTENGLESYDRDGFEEEDFLDFSQNEEDESI